MPLNAHLAAFPLLTVPVSGALPTVAPTGEQAAKVPCMHLAELEREPGQGNRLAQARRDNLADCASSEVAPEVPENRHRS